MRSIGALVLPAVLLVTSLVAGPAGAQSPPQAEVAKKFFGAWRGANPKGMIYYDPSGAMAAQIAPDRHVKMAGPEPTPEEAKAALADYVAYFGTYTIDERAGTVTHHRQGNVQPGDRPDLVRSYEFVGDRLILRPVGSKQEVVWERFK